MRAIIGVQPQSPSFQDKTKLTELLELFASAYGLKVDVRKHLADVQLEDKANSYVEQLSGGQRQRFSIAAALVHEPKVFFLDEPTTGLHLDDVRVLISVLDRLVDAGHTVLVIEHHMDVIKRADWVIDMGPEAGNDGGQVVAQGTPEQVAEIEGSHTGRYLKEVLEEPAFAGTA